MQPNDNTKKLQFHIESDDYHATLATVLNLHEQDQANRITTEKDKQEQLRQVVKNLMHLQQHYKIVKR